MKKLLTIILLPIAGLALFGLGYTVLFMFSINSNKPPRAPMDAEIYGRVVLGPTCPVIKEGDTNCLDQPYQTEVSVSYQSTPGSDLALGAGTVITDADGRYSIPLKPSAGGVYSVRAKGGRPFPRCDSERFEITAKESLEININCDTGIR